MLSGSKSVFRCCIRMSNSDRGAKGPTTDIVTTSSKLTDIKLDGDGENYVEGKYLVQRVSGKN